MKRFLQILLFFPLIIGFSLNFSKTASAASNTTDACIFHGPPTSEPEGGQPTNRRILVTIENTLDDDLKVTVTANHEGGKIRYSEDITLAGKNTQNINRAEFFLAMNQKAPPGEYQIIVKVKPKKSRFSVFGVFGDPLGPPECQGTKVNNRVQLEEIPNNSRDITSTLKNVENPVPFGSLGEVLTALIPNIFAIAGMLGFAFLVFGGIRYALARGDMKATDSARGVITNAITGLVIILVVFVIFEIITAVFKLSIFSLVPTVKAQESIDIGSKLKLGNDPIAGIFPNIASLVTAIIAAATALMGLIFFALLIFGGIRYMLARGDEKATQAARGVLTNAVIGLLIVLGAFAIITLIGLFTGQSTLLP